MLQKTNNYIHQYKALFYLSWICLYLIFPAWISLHSVIQAKSIGDLSNPLARSVGILGLILYFFLSSFLIDRCFRYLILDKPVIAKIKDSFTNIKNNLWLAAGCLLAVILHIPSFFTVELGYLNQGLWLYDFSNRHWHTVFDIPIQYGFWSFLVLFVFVIKKANKRNSMSGFINSYFTLHTSRLLPKILFMSGLFFLFSLYSLLFPYAPEESVKLLRFPPVSNYLYLLTYYAFGVSPVGPRLVQLMFYVLSSIYIYRTIILFRERETALFGSLIYLFSPVIFHYASFTALASGTVFFMILISFHFLRFLKSEDNRDLILTAYFMGIGFMYKRVLLVMFIICFSYLVLRSVIKRDSQSAMHLKILLLSLITILPFYMIGKSGLNFYSPSLSNLTSITSLFPVIQSQLSVLLSSLFLLSVIAVPFTKRDDLSLFYVFYFGTYYVFFLLASAPAAHRYSMAYYPAIAVLMAQVILTFPQGLKHRKVYSKVCISAVTIYLVYLCLVPRYSSSLITFKYEDFESQLYPIEHVTDWIKESIAHDEKILFLSMPRYYEFYIERIYPDRDKINSSRFIYYLHTQMKDLLYPLENLKAFCYSENISYIIFPYGPKNSFPDVGAREDVKYLARHSGDGLTEVSRFNHEDNYIVVYKLNDNTAAFPEKFHPPFSVSGI